MERNWFVVYGQECSQTRFKIRRKGLKVTLGADRDSKWGFPRPLWLHPMCIGWIHSLNLPSFYDWTCNSVQDSVSKHGIYSIVLWCYHVTGTGKTVTGAYLVYFFTEQNKLLPNRRDEKRPQILYCGPSNDVTERIPCHMKSFQPLFCY